MYIIADLHSADPLNSKDEDSIKYFIEGVPLATSCNDKPCEFEEEFPWNNVRLPTFIKPIRYDIELTPNLTTLVVKGTSKTIRKRNLIQLLNSMKAIVFMYKALINYF